MRQREETEAVAGKCPRSGVGKELYKVSGCDRMMETVHDGRGPEANREIPIDGYDLKNPWAGGEWPVYSRRGTTMPSGKSRYRKVLIYSGSVHVLAFRALCV